MNEEKIQELKDVLKDPTVSEAVKATIRQGLQKLAEGGFRAAYDTNLAYLARNNLDAFSEYVYELKPYPHHKEITRILQDETRTREIIVTPPGHAKSTYVSNQFPAWWMGKYPEKSAIIVSRSATQAQAFLGSISETIRYSEKYQSVFPETKPHLDRGWTKEHLFLKNRANGARPDPNLLSSGVIGPIVGRRAELIIVDDAQDAQDASSDTISNSQKDWIKKTLMTRVKPGGRVIVVMTRWHSDDLASMFHNQMDFRLTLMPAVGDADYGAYVEYFLPGSQYRDGSDEALEDILQEALAEGKEAEIMRSPTMNKFCVRKYLHENHGRALWPQEHDMKALNIFKKTLGSVQFDLVYNGNATGMSGDVFKREWFREYGPGCEKEFVPDGSYWFQSVDVAVSTKESADYFVIATVAVDLEGNYYIVDIFRKRLEAPLQPKTIASKYREHGLTQWVLVESNAYQLALFQNVIAEGIPARKYKSMKDKQARARSAAARFEANIHPGAGKVYVNKLGDWVDEFKDELTSFPRGDHDDQVDAISSLFEELALNPIKPVTYRVSFG